MSRVPEEVTAAQASIIYAEEADVLNVAMFGMTARQWREANQRLVKLNQIAIQQMQVLEASGGRKLLK